MGAVSINRGAPRDLDQLDLEWLGLGEGEASAHWRFHALGLGRAERFCIVSEKGEFVGVWLDHDPLVCGDAYQLDFLKRRPGPECAGFGRYLLGMVALRALEKGASRVVFQPLEPATGFFTGWGAQKCSDWRGGETLPNLELPKSSLTSLSEALKTYEQPSPQIP